jgi:quinolinate synthase
MATPVFDLESRLEGLDPTLDLVGEIARLKRERNAVLLAHYYQQDEIQDIADYVGDSLGLSQQAAGTDADVIVFCGVHFMAETAKILNPGKRVLLPDLDAGCSLADRCGPDELAEWLTQYPDHVVVSYINTSAAVKALSDVICTSSNAVRVVASIPQHRKIVFVPDRHLGRWVMKQTGRDMVLWPGFCVVHEQFSARRIVALREDHPRAQVVAHPECEQSVLELADHVASTTGLLKHVETSKHDEFIVATEVGILHQMRLRRPGVTLIPAPPNSGCNCSICPYMRLNTLEKVYLALRDGVPAIEVPEDIRRRALIPVQRMLEIG